jgi:Glycosyltransferase family 87
MTSVTLTTPVPLRTRVWRGIATRPFLPLLATVAAFAVGYAQKLPCYAVSWHEKPKFNQFCYSDIAVLFRQRDLINGIFPYSAHAFPHPLEYPVVIGLFMDATGRLGRWLIPGADLPAATRMYFDINVLVLLCCALVTVWATWVMLRGAGKPAAALLVAFAPSLALAGTINWDLIATMLCVLALLAWVQDRPVLAGVLVGLGTAAKLYPLLLLAALVGLCVRQRRLREFGMATAAAVVAWAVVNLPIAVLYPDGWLEFWRFNTRRRADYGSVWHALSVMGLPPIPGLNTITTGLLVLLWLGIVALALRATRPPTAAQLTFLTVAAFLVTNKVYSPQYVLWLLPLMVLARVHLPQRRALPALAVWQVAELIYWVVIWRFLIHLPEGQGWQYPAATFLRVAVTIGFAVLVVRDCLREDVSESAAPGVADAAAPSVPDAAAPGVPDAAPDGSSPAVRTRAPIVAIES